MQIVLKLIFKFNVPSFIFIYTFMTINITKKGDYDDRYFV